MFDIPLQHAAQRRGLARHGHAVEGQGCRKPHARMGIIQHGHQPHAGVGVFSQPGHGILPHVGRGVGEGAGQVVAAQATRPREQPASPKPGFGERSVGERLAEPGFESADGRGCRSLNRVTDVDRVGEQPVGRFPPPAKGMPEFSHEILVREFGKRRARGWKPIPGHDPVDPPAVMACADVEGRPRGSGNVVGMLDHVSLHVEEIECAIRTVLEADGAAGGIARGDELAGLFLRRPARPEGRPILPHQVTVHEIRDDVAHEHATCQPGGERRALKKTHATGRREAARLLRMIHPGGRRDDRKQLGRGAVVGDVVGGGKGCDVARGFELVDRQDLLLQVIDIVGGEAMPGCIGHETEAACGLEGAVNLPAAEAEGHVGLSQHHRGGSGVGKPHTAVESKSQAVSVAVGYPEGDTLDHLLTEVGHAIAVGVFQIEKIRRRQHEHAPPPGEHRCGKTELCCKHDRFVGPAVAVCVAEPADGAPRLPIWPRAKRIVSHLHHVAAAIGRERSCHGIDHLRLGCPEFEGDVGVVLELARGMKVGGRQRGNVRIALPGEQGSHVEATITLIGGGRAGSRCMGHPESARRGLEQHVMEVRLHGHRPSHEFHRCGRIDPAVGGPHAFDQEVVALSSRQQHRVGHGLRHLLVGRSHRHGLEPLRPRLHRHRLARLAVGDHIKVFAGPRAIAKDGHCVCQSGRPLECFPHQNRHRHALPPAQSGAPHLTDAHPLGIDSGDAADEARISDVDERNVSLGLRHHDHRVLLKLPVAAIVDHSAVVGVAIAGCCA